MQKYQKELEVAKGLAKEAGRIMLKYFDGDQQIEKKEDKSFVTIADKLINSLVIKKLTVEFPDDGVIGEEESNTEYGMGRKWICDPIDGTASFINGVAQAMFSLALVIDGVPVLGIAYDPFTDKLYHSIKGEKSFCNDKEISVSNLDKDLGVFGMSGNIRALLKKDYFKKMIEDDITISTLGGAVFKGCHVAKGKFIAYIDNGVNAHDVAAIHVIVESAGGKITGMRGETLDYSKPFRGAIITNGIVHELALSYCA